jgi:hypothetical protein
MFLSIKVSANLRPSAVNKKSGLKACLGLIGQGVAEKFFNIFLKWSLTD